MRRHRGRRAFALLLVLGVLAFTVLLAVTLAMLGRIGARLTQGNQHQVAARQNALLALQVALGELQRHAGPDDRVTGTAGVVGVGPGESTRQWTGVWDGGAQPVWLASGGGRAERPILPATSRIQLVGPGAVGNPADRTDQELVAVALVPVPGLSPEGERIVPGRMAWWVGDEGVKISAVILDGEVQAAGGSGVALRPNFRRLIGGAFVPGSAANARLLALEQLRVAVSGFSLPPAFHAVTRSHAALPGTAPSGEPRPDGFVIGAFNLNTTSESVWRAWLEFPDHNDSVFALSATRTLSAARQLRDRIAARGVPFRSVAEFRDSGIVAAAFAGSSPKVTTISEDDFLTALAPVLAVRSDTFRVRAYGDSLNPADPARIEAAACGEAIVQRTSGPAPGGGRRFTVLSFRWLGPDDI